jgi:hypothetical protein
VAQQAELTDLVERDEWAGVGYGSGHASSVALSVFQSTLDIRKKGIPSLSA